MYGCLHEWETPFLVSAWYIYQKKACKPIITDLELLKSKTFVKTKNYSPFDRMLFIEWSYYIAP
jgi:hypothetical protein